MPWKPGQSGNPAGKRRSEAGRNALRASIEKEMPAIIKRLIELAKDGDVQASRTLLERVLPAVKPEALAISLPGVTAAQDATKQAEEVVRAIAMSELAPDIGAMLLTGLGQMARVTEVDQLAREVAELRQEIRGKR